MKDYEKLSKLHFDKQAAVYDETETVFYSKFPKISCADVAKRLSEIKYSKLLDIGCGTGYLLDLLRHRSDAVFYGLDLSPEMVKVARKKLGKSVYLTEGSALTLPYDSSVFDVVTCVQSFHHYPDPTKAMKEAYRVTASGGRYILSDTGVGGFGQWIDNHLMFKLMHSGDYAAYSRHDIEKMMRQTGFEIETSEQLTKTIYTVVGKKAEAAT